MTPEQEFLRRIELKAQAVRLCIGNGDYHGAAIRALEIERLAREERVGITRLGV